MTVENTARLNHRDSNYTKYFKELLALADIDTNGGRAWDIQLHNPKMFQRVLSDGSLGFGESYIDGWWDCESLDGMFTRLIGARLHRRLKGLSLWKFRGLVAWNALVNLQSKERAFQVGEAHYDIGNDLYRVMLDPTMTYSCAYWRDADNLAEAQLAKLDLICRKLHLQAGMSLLDIGCGWGGLAAHAAKHYGVRVTGVTISREQAAFIKERYRALDIDVRLQDYRELQGQFDRVVSVGMFEHVGPKNYREYFKVVRRVLAPHGLFLLHTIGEELTTHASDPFINKYIFPNGKIASRKHLNDASLDLLRLEDWHNFGSDYDLTLMSWARNFEKNWSGLSRHYSERFYRMWRYYLYCSAGFFRSREGQLWQLVFAHPDNLAPYHSLR